ncbi:unnamed protein product [Peniophora sp. CBMAI 1063]|nr:unnamed protein product [Peniophora sp. CBMAI 1063]
MENLVNQPACDRDHLRYLAEQYSDAYLKEPSMANFDELNASLVANLAFNKYTPGDPDVIPDLEKALDDYTAAVHDQNPSRVLQNLFGLYGYMATRGVEEGRGYRDVQDLRRKVRFK